MANINFKLLRSSTAAKRPTAAQLAEGELGLNFNTSEPGLFFEDAAGVIRKVGPAHVSSTAPNASPQGYAGLSAGESWLDTGVTPNVLKIWDGSAWQSAGAGGVPGGNVTEIQYNSFGAFAGSADFVFDGTNVQIGSQGELRYADATSSNYVGFQAPAALTSNTTFVLPNGDGTSGDALTTDGTGTLSWAAPGGTPGGNTTEVQFNNAGAFDGNSNFTFNDADEILSVTTVQGDLDGAVVFTAEASVNITKGQVVYIDGIQGNNPTVNLARANSSTTMPAFGIADADISSGSTGHIVSFGQIGNLDTDTPGFSIGDTLYVSATSPGELINTPPSGESNLVQNVGRVERVSSTVGRIVVAGAGRTNATPNLNDGNIFVGNASNQSVATAMTGDVTIDNTGATTIKTDVVLAGTPTTTTQSANDNSLAIATTAYVDTSIATNNSLADTNIFVGNGSNVATGVAMSGDATIANTGAITIANDAITTVKILDDAVTNGKIVNDAITGDKIVDGNVTGAKIETSVALGGSPTTTTQPAGTNNSTIATTEFVINTSATAVPGLNDGKIFVGDASNTAAGVDLSGDATIDNTGALTIANDAVTTVKIIDDAVTNAKIVDDAITTAKIQNDAVTTGKIVNDAITTDKIFDANVTSAKIQTDVALAGNPTTTTQNAGTSNTTIATTAYVDAAAAAAVPSLTDANIFVGNASDVPTDVTMSGDATIANTGALTISNDAVTTVKIADANVTSAKVQTDVALGGSPTTTTQSAGDSSTKIATTAFVTGAITTSNSLTDGNIFVGDANDVAAGVAVSGDVTLSNTGVVGIINDVNLGGNPTTTTQADSDNSTRIATTAYVQTRIDGALQGLSSKASVVAATTGNITLSGTQTIDGVPLSAGDRVLVKDQTSAAENGIYAVASGTWARTTDADIWDELVGAFVFTTTGTANADTGYTTQIVSGGTLGTTAIPWVQFSSAGQVTAGDGLVKTGSVLDVVTADATRIVVNSNDIDLATTGVSAGTYTSLTVDAYGRATSGTTPTTFAGYSISDNSAGLASVLSDETGTGFVVFSTSPALTGVPTAPTATALDNSTTLATTAYVDGAIGTSNSLNDTNIFVGNGSNVATGVAMSGDATIANTGALTIANDAITTVKILDANVTGAKIESNVALAGSPTTTTQTQGDNSTKVSTTAYVDAAIAAVPGAAQLNSAEIFLGNASNATAQVTMSGDVTLNNTGVSTIKNSVALAGSPTTTTQTAGDNSTKIATTAYADAAAAAATPSLTDSEIFVGNGSNVATSVAMSGDATIANTGAITIANDAVTTVKILDDAVTGDKISDNVALAGSPTTTTQTAGDSSTKIATTAFVTTAVSSATPTLTSGDIFVGSASNEATAVTMSGDITIAATGATTIKTDVALAGSPTTTTQSAGDNSTKIATTAYVDATSGSSVTVSATAPSSPAQGDLWYNTVDGRMYVYYNDGNTTQWVDASPNGLNPAPGSDTQVIFNDNGTVSATSDLTIGSSSIGVGVDVLPDTDNTYDLGSPDFRFANIYTGDLHLKNDRGDWTMIEEDDALTMRNNKTGKVYNIMMQERA